MISLIFIFFSAAIISLILTFPLIGVLKLFKFGQPVRAEGPASHGAKAGTPTMGGLGFLVTIIAFALILIDVELHPAYLALSLLMLAFAGIGLADDLLKVFRKRNLGLTFWEKIILQLLVAGAFAVYLTFLGYNLSLYGLPAKLGFANPYLYQLLIIFFVVGFANATNLTDGLNGLLAGTGGSLFCPLPFWPFLPAWQTPRSLRSRRPALSWPFFITIFPAPGFLWAMSVPCRSGRDWPAWLL